LPFGILRFQESSADVDCMRSELHPDIIAGTPGCLQRGNRAHAHLHSTLNGRTICSVCANRRLTEYFIALSTSTQSTWLGNLPIGKRVLPRANGDNHSFVERKVCGTSQDDRFWKLTHCNAVRALASNSDCCDQVRFGGVCLPEMSKRAIFGRNWFNRKALVVCSLYRLR